MNHILIIDDNANIRQLFRAALESEFRVIEAENGTDGLAIIRRERPKIVFLDVMMPGDLNGLQVLSAIREEASIRDTIVVMVTARGQTSDLENAERHGADGYLTKPFSPIELLKWVRANLPERAH